MRYLLPLLLFPSLSYAQCHAGVNYGQYPITAGNPVCAPYTGSSLGGCFAYCGGSDAGSVCVEFPLGNPPSKGPYFSNGNECQYYSGSDGNSSGNSGGNPGGTDGTNQGGNGVVDVGAIMVGDKYASDLGKGFNAVANNVNKSSEKVQKSVKELAEQLDAARLWDNANYMDVMKNDLARIAQNTSGIGNGSGSGSNDEAAGYLKSINGQIAADSARTDAYRSEFKQMFESLSYSVSHMAGFPNQQELININQNTNSMTKELVNISQNSNSLKGTLWNISDEVQRQSYDIADMLKELKKISSGEGGDGEGGGDKPCEGPLCTFTPPSSSGSGSGLSSVFGEQDIAGIKQQVTERKADIQEQMDQIKGVFSPGKLEISGTYNNDYQDIHGARVDLSGKSNFELFFSSGPKQVLWFLAVLIAFGILLGGRKDA